MPDRKRRGFLRTVLSKNKPPILKGTVSVRVGSFLIMLYFQFSSRLLESSLLPELFCAFFVFLNIKNKKTAHVGTDKINPNKSEATRHAKNPPMAKPNLCFIAPQIAGTAPTAADRKSVV